MKKLCLPLLAVLLVSHIAQGQTADGEKPNETPLPQAMAKEQILSLLEEQKHIVNERQIADVQSLIGHLKKNVPPKEYPLIIQQVTAIDSAGKSKDAVFTPYLLDYLDYVSLNSALISSPLKANQLSVRRERYPALNALLNINSPKDVVLYIESNKPLEKRLWALGALTDIDYDQAIPASEHLLQEDEVKKDPHWVAWINNLMQERLPKPKGNPDKK